MKNDEKATRNHFNNLAGNWDENCHPEKQKIIHFLKEIDLKPDQKILDLGCGTGVLFPYLSELTEEKSEICAIDSAICMAATAFKKNSANVEIICADIQFLPLSSCCFDRIIAYQVFPHISNQFQAIKECYRILKQGGLLAIVHPRGSQEMNDFHKALGGVVESHILLSGEKMAALAKKTTFEIRIVRDNPEEYFIVAQKK